MSNPYIAVSELTNVIYIIDGKKKYDVTKEVMGAVILTHRAIPTEKLEQIRAEIAEKENALNYTTVSDVALKTAYIEVLKNIDKALKEQNI